jgi:hypothetical protein
MADTVVSHTVRTLCRCSRGTSTGEVIGYGSTVRSFDSRAGRWWIVWQDPVAGELSVLFATAEGDCVCQWTLGGLTRAFRWTFSEITDDSFHWARHIEQDGGEWRLVEEFFAKRVSA